jgi:cell division septation protein DedD
VSDAHAPREVTLRLDPIRIALVLAIVVFAAGAFVLLRRPVGMPHAGGGPGAPPDSAELKMEDVAKSVSFFDRGDSGAATNALPPRRDESSRAAAAGSGREPVATTGRTAPPGRTGTGPGSGGSQPAPGRRAGEWAVQVFAGDAPGAESLRNRLMTRGWPATVVAGADGRHRVRVGGYPTRSEAERQAGRLGSSEGLTTWIVSPAP